MNKASLLKPEEKVLEHIRKSIDNGELKPGNRLPAERKLAEELGVSRTKVREAIQKMEFHGIVKTLPQSGTYISAGATEALETMVADMIRMEKFEFTALVHVRTLLELDAAKLCAELRTEEDIKQMEMALKGFEDNFNTPLKVEKDLAFHHSIALGAHNPILTSLLQIISPDVLSYYHKFQICSVPEEIVKREHRSILDAIKRSDSDEAVVRMKEHFKALTGFSANIPDEKLFV